MKEIFTVSGRDNTGNLITMVIISNTEDDAKKLFIGTSNDYDHPFDLENMEELIVHKHDGENKVIYYSSGDNRDF